jgi:hypothetical protein
MAIIKVTFKGKAKAADKGTIFTTVVGGATNETAFTLPTTGALAVDVTVTDNATYVVDAEKDDGAWIIAAPDLVEVTTGTEDTTLRAVKSAPRTDVQVEIALTRAIIALCSSQLEELAKGTPTIADVNKLQRQFKNRFKSLN